MLNKLQMLLGVFILCASNSILYNIGNGINRQTLKSLTVKILIKGVESCLKEVKFLKTCPPLKENPSISIYFLLWNKFVKKWNLN